MGDKHKNSNSLKQRYRSNEKFFLICTSWSHSPVEILLRRNQEYLNQVFSLPYKINSLFTFKSSEIILLECIYFAQPVQKSFGRCMTRPSTRPCRQTNSFDEGFVRKFHFFFFFFVIIFPFYFF